MTKFTLPERSYELLKDGEGVTAKVDIRYTTGPNGQFEIVGHWEPIKGLSFLGPFVDRNRMLAAKCAEEFVKG